MRCRFGQSVFRSNSIKSIQSITLKTDVQRLFETLDSVGASIVFTGAPYILYEQFKLDDNFRTNLEGTLLSEHVSTNQTYTVPNIF